MTKKKEKMGEDKEEEKKTERQQKPEPTRRGEQHRSAP